ncbi:hypothetical protein GGU10DRAFT_401546 [Lentinula aff. detonsa]|uniref:Protein kinase domain-containing protein n=1 Tax=Lentinula aff. detonsa TaxID=2804958 RepID=A0AA38KNR6_9AGAR|nr:hypothetical protein GGU10DRAFT_401546 [Lentinula aff. detonsa]
MSNSKTYRTRAKTRNATHYIQENDTSATLSREHGATQHTTSPNGPTARNVPLDPVSGSSRPTGSLQPPVAHPHGQDEDETADLLDEEEDLSDDEVDELASQTPATPKHLHVVSDSVLVTPFGRYSHTYSPSISNDHPYKVDEVNKFLEADLTELRILPLAEWAQYAMNLDLDRDDYTLSKTTKTRFKQYFKAVDAAKLESQIYPALVDLLNSFSNKGKKGDNIVFHIQDPFPVRGSIVEQKPDIGATLKGLFKGKLKKLTADVNGRIYWGLLPNVVEGKLERVGKDAKDLSRNQESERPRTSDTQSNSSKKRARSRDTHDRARKMKRLMEGSPSKLLPRGPAGRKVASGLSSLLYLIICHAKAKKLDFAQQAASQPAMALRPHTLKAVPPRMTPLGTRVQVGGYARDMMSLGVIRSHAINFIVDSKFARAIYYDRSTIVESGLLKLENEEDQLIFAKMIKHLRALPLEGLGIVPNLDAKFMKDPKSLDYGFNLPQYTAADGPPSNEIFEHPQGSLFTFPYKDGKTRTVHLKRVLFRSHGIIGRGTIVIRIKCACAGCGGHCDWAGKDLVLKLSFPGETRVSEQTFMDRCRELAIGEHEWVFDHLPNIYWSFDIPFREGSPQKNFKKKYDKQYEMRIMRGSIQEELQPLTGLTTARECAQVFYDVVQCHHWVWKYPQILHRDISPGNIMVREKNGQKFGVLNDWDLAIWVNDLRDGPTSKFRTGTTPYMAHEQHSVEWKGPHRYRHDMESMFYVILLLTCLCSSPGEKLVDPPVTDYSYEQWHQQGDFSLRATKESLIHRGAWQPSTTPFFDGFSSWLESLQCELSLGFSELQKYLRATKTAQKIQQNSLPHPMTEVPSFDEDSLGGYFSYKDVVLIMHVFADDALETRSREWQEMLRQEK